MYQITLKTAETQLDRFIEVAANKDYRVHPDFADHLSS